MKYDEVKEWENTFNTVSAVNSRGETYDAFKKRKAEKLLDEVEKKFPGLRNCYSCLLHGYAAFFPGLYW